MCDKFSPKSIDIVQLHGRLRFLSDVGYTPCLKKLCQLIFCYTSVKYEPISIKIVRIVPEETLNKTVSKNARFT